MKKQINAHNYAITVDLSVFYWRLFLKDINGNEV